MYDFFIDFVINVTLCYKNSDIVSSDGSVKELHYSLSLEINRLMRKEVVKCLKQYLKAWFNDCDISIMEDFLDIWNALEQ